MHTSVFNLGKDCLITLDRKLFFLKILNTVIWRHSLIEWCCNRLPFARNNCQGLSANSHSLRFAETLGVATCFKIKSVGSFSVRFSVIMVFPKADLTFELKHEFELVLWNRFQFWRNSQLDILLCSWFEAEKKSSSACAQGTFWNTAHTLSSNQTQIILHCKSRPHPHATSPQKDFSTSCSIIAYRQ